LNTGSFGNIGNHLVSKTAAVPEFATSSAPIDRQVQQPLSDAILLDCVKALIGCHLVTGGTRAALGVAHWLGFHVIPKECEKQQQQLREQEQHEEEQKRQKAEEFQNQREQRRLRLQQRAMSQGQPQPTGAAKQNSMAARLLKQHLAAVRVEKNSESQTLVSTPALPR